MGAVWEVVHVRLGKRYALKQLKSEFEGREDVKKRFDREALTMAELVHPHIVQVFDIDVEPDFGAFILMDLITGSTLGKIIREQGRRPLAEVVRIGTEIASALDFAHRKGVVHRDIKPGNILIEEGTGRAVLTDFGIAKQLHPDGDETADGTRTGMFVGTYRYSSPEQMRNEEEPHARWDIYSFGIVLYETFSGKRFLDHMAEGQIMAHVAYMPDWTPPLEFPEPPPPLFRRVIDECLERDGSRRLSSAAELVRRLQACLSEADQRIVVEPRPAAPAPPPPPPPPREDSRTEATRVETYAQRRAALRTTANEQLALVERLETELQTLGAPRGDWPAPFELRATLERVTALEQSGQYEEAVGRLSALGERAAEVQAAITNALRQHIAAELDELKTAWQAVTGGPAGALVAAADADGVAQRIAVAERAAAAGQRAAAVAAIGEGRQLAARAEQAAAERAEAERVAAERARRAAEEQARRVAMDLAGAEKDLHAVEQLAEEAGAAGADIGDGQALAALRTALATAAEQQRAGQHAEALQGLAAIGPRIAAARGDLETSLRDGLAAALRGLREQLGDLGKRAGDLVSPQAARPVEQGLTAVERHLKEEQWVRGWRALDAARGELEKLAGDVRDRARAALAEAGQEIDAALAELAESGAVQKLDRGQLDARIQERVAAGQFGAALRDATAVRTELRGALDQVRDAAARAAAAARDALDQALRGLDLAAAKAVAPQDVARAEAAEKQGREALQRKDHRAAGAAFATARAAYAAAAERLAQDQVGRIEALTGEVRALLQRAEKTPDVVAAEARRQAGAALDAAGGADRVAALVALDTARAAVQQALADAGVYASALEQQAAAAAAQAQLGDLPVPERERRAAEQSTAAAAAAFERHRWAEARDQYAESAQAWTALEAEGQKRAAEARERAREIAAAKQALGSRIEQSRAEPDEIVAAIRAQAAKFVADAQATMERLREVDAALAAAIAEGPPYRAAAAQRAQAKVEEQRAVALRPSSRPLKAARKVAAEAEAHFGARRWQQAAERYTAASAAFAALAAAQEAAATPAAPGVTPAARPLPVAAIGGGVAALVAVVGAVLYLRSGTEEVPVVPPVARATVARPEATVARAQPTVARVEATIARPPATVAVPAPAPPEVPPVAAVPFIAAAIPAADSVHVKENQRAEFSVTVAGAPAGAKPDTRWTLDGKEVASAATEWAFAPGFDAARDQPYALRVQVGDGAGEKASRTWSIAVDDVNRPPKLKTSPAPGTKVSKNEGEKVAFAVEAKDEDGDALHYAWTVDGKPAGSDAPAFELPVSGDQKVAVAVRDGKGGDPVSAAWNVASIKAAPVALQLNPLPKQLASLRFSEPQKFELGIPAELRQVPLTFSWTVDGRPVSDKASFQFANDDPALVRDKPVQIAALARADAGRTFSYDWKVKVLPPPPRITAATPDAKALEVAPGAAQAFELSAAEPVGGQKLTYVFDANGKETRSGAPRFELKAAEGQSYTIIASIADNFGQRSDKRTWTIKSTAPRVTAREPTAVVAAVAPADLTSRVQSWLERYRAAFNAKDIASLQQLLRLDSTKAKALEGALGKQANLRVTFSNVKIEQVGPDRARVSYQRVDEFTDPYSNSGKSMSTAVNQSFRLVGDRLELEKPGS